jgi:hypothetical protein
MEVLSRMMPTTVDMRLLLRFLVGSRNNEEFIVSFLLFVDDILIFYKVIGDHLPIF